MLIEAVNSELEDFKKNGVLKFKEVIEDVTNIDWKG